MTDVKYDQIIDVRLLAPLATCMAIIVSTILWLLNQRRKQLSYRVLWQDALTHARSAVRERLTVTFDGVPVKDAGLAIVQIVNSGHIAVVPGDYHSPLTISAGPGARVLFAEVTSTVPGDLEERCRTATGERRELIEVLRGNEVVLAPVLLNDGDSITVQMLVEDLRGGVKVGGHVNGVRRISVWKPRTLVSTLLTNVGAFVMAFSVFFVEPSAVVRYGWEEALPAILFFLLGYTLLSAGIYGKPKNAATPSLEAIT